MYKCAVHAHPDAFLRRYKKSRGRTVEISMPFSKERLQAVAEVIESREQVMLNDWAMLTGEVKRTSFEASESEFFIERGGAILKDPFLDDQSMLINVESKGLVIITGCAHSGIINIIDHATRIAGTEKVYAVIGGLHMVDYSAGKMEKTIELLKERGPTLLMPCHCTGIEGIIALREGLGKSVRPCAAGMEIEL
jgi:7,8-dihydropterin-6-yl-methyl-4-(beta-D-ribofuranosyl)aminobenzene 5'-phosphate synthase